MKEQLLKLKEAALEEIKAVSAIDELDSIKVKYSGKKGELTKLLKGMGKLSAERPVMGKVANEVRELIETKINEKRTALKKIEQEAKLQSVKVNENVQEATSGLMVLGYSRKDIEKVFEHLAVESLSVEDLIKKGLVLLTTK